MRRVTQHDDRGLVTIMVVILLPVLLLGVTLAIDAGAAAYENASAQTTADSIALASAMSCAQGMPAGTVGVDPIPNKRTSKQTVTPLACGNGQITVNVTQPVNFTFIPTPSGTQAHKQATAKWQQLKSGIISPITIGSCSFATNPPLNTRMMLWSVTGCNGQPGSQKGWINEGCKVASIGNLLTGTTGNNPGGTSCPSDLNQWFLTQPGIGAKDLLLPVWTSYSSGYTITVIMRFRVDGWSGNGNNWGGTMTSRCTATGTYLSFKPGDSTKPCIVGQIVGYGTQIGGTTGAPCLTDALRSACFVFLAS